MHSSCAAATKSLVRLRSLCGESQAALERQRSRARRQSEELNAQLAELHRARKMFAVLASKGVEAAETHPLLEKLTKISRARKANAAVLHDVRDDVAASVVEETKKVS